MDVNDGLSESTDATGVGAKHVSNARTLTTPTFLVAPAMTVMTANLLMLHSVRRQMSQASPPPRSWLYRSGKTIRSCPGFLLA
jgi:hypothetical protein